MHKSLPSIENFISRNAKKVSEISQVYLRTEWNELTAVKNWLRSSLEEEEAPFRFGAVVLIEKLVLNVAYEKIRKDFGTHGHAIDLFKITVREWITVEC